MNFGIEKIKDWNRSKSCSLSTHFIHKIINNTYCKSLNTLGACPVDCALCKDNVIDMLSLDDARIPVALLTWKTRNALGRAKEDFRKSEKTVLSDTGSYDQNPFETILQTL